MKAIIYARVSSISDRQNTERQIEDLKVYASKNGYSVEKVFSEKISGAKKNSEREVLLSCLDFAKSNGIDIILVSELSRFGRAIWEVLETVKYCADNRINVFFQKEGLQILDEKGEVLPTMAIYISCLGFAAEMERKNIAFRLNSGRELAKQKGVKMGRKEGSVKSKEEKELQYKKVISLLKKGLSVANVAAICKSEGIKASTSTIKRIKKEFNL
jgi:DNA invertase Pin-like site-specific DNA recombinase